MRTKSVIIGAGIAGMAGVAIAAHFKQKAAGCPDNNDIFCPETNDQTGVLARADIREQLETLSTGVPQVPFTGFNYALDGQ